MKGAKVTYFPGTAIARMNSRSGVNARLAGTYDAAKDVRGSIHKELARLFVAKGLAAKDTARVLAMIEQDVLDGLKMGAVEIKNDMSRTPPLLPVDTGTLKASFKIQLKEGSTDTLEVGWPDTSVKKLGSKKEEPVEQYAAFVHEMTTPPYGNVNWSLANSGPKFLEASLKRNAAKVGKIVANHVKSTTSL
jgi:hypothetical protein